LFSKWEAEFKSHLILNGSSRVAWINQSQL